jgi:hypothetical protein
LGPLALRVRHTERLLDIIAKFLNGGKPKNAGIFFNDHRRTLKKGALK